MVPSISFSGRECRHADKIFAFPARTEFSVTTPEFVLDFIHYASNSPTQIQAQHFCTRQVPTQQMLSLYFDKDLIEKAFRYIVAVEFRSRTINYAGGTMSS
jgi:hypothetical protein